jgi:hypothetical protein
MLDVRVSLPRVFRALVCRLCSCLLVLPPGAQHVGHCSAWLWHTPCTQTYIFLFSPVHWYFIIVRQDNSGNCGGNTHTSR